MFPSGPATIPHGDEFAVGTVNFTTSPTVEMRPTRSGHSVNQRLPSGPHVIILGKWFKSSGGSILNAARSPEGVTRPTFLASSSVNQMFPSALGVVAVAL